MRSRSQGSLAQKTQGALMTTESSGSSSTRMLRLLLGRAQPWGRPQSGGHIWEVAQLGVYHNDLEVKEKPRGCYELCGLGQVHHLFKPQFPSL